MEVEVVRSARRRKTVAARVVDGVIRVTVPAGMSEADERRYVDALVTRVERRRCAEEVDLEARAAVLADRYRLPKPASIRWADNQSQRWGSCTIQNRAVRISARLVGLPAWVVDYVIVHELAHLVEPGHGARFRKLVDRYPKAERAHGYLMAKGIEGD